MKNAMLKNAFSEMKKTKSRFLSIFGIIAVGTGFFSGLLTSAPDMRYTSDKYYDDGNLMNYRVVSTYGFNENDIKAIKDIEGVNVFPGYFADVFVRNEGSDSVARVYSLDEAGKSGKYNAITVTEGRMPENDNECLIDAGKLVSQYGIGDTISLRADFGSDLDDMLSSDKYTIVGRFDTPMFVSDVERGNTTIGNGSIDILIYLPENNFTFEYYTEVFITADKLAGYNCYSEEYENAGAELKTLIEAAAKTRETDRLAEIKADNEKKIADGEKELEDSKKEAYDKINDGEKELDDAKAQLDDAKAQLDDGKKQLDDAKAQLDDSEKQLADAKKELEDNAVLLKDTEKQLADGKIQLDEAKAELDKNAEPLSLAEKQLADGKAQLDGAKAELDKNAALLAESEKQLADGKAQLDSTKKQLDDAKEQLDDAADDISANQMLLYTLKAQLEAGVATGLIDEETAAYQRALINVMQNNLDDAKQQYQDGLKQYEDGLAQYEEGLKQYNEGKAQYDEGLEKFNTGKAQYEDALSEYNKGYAEYSAGLEKYNEGKAQYEAALNEYNDGVAQYENGLLLYDEGKAQYEDGLKQYEDGLKQYEDGLEEYNKNYADYEDGVKKYEDGVKELEDAKAEAEEKIADAEKKIADARKTLDELAAPQWYVFDRDDNPGYSEYGQNAERINNIAIVFPAFFVIVAALVCLTTMTRMVEEQRTQIGTLKGLGYKNGDIIMKYMIYAVTAAASGAVFGMLAGMKLFPAIIVGAYGMMYKIHAMVMPYDPTVFALTLVSAVLLVGFTVFFSCRAALREQPASLMRPKAPKIGKKIMMERIGFIWKHISFSHKVTMRNLFRYKRRMFMTVVGIAGCTALVLTGFAIYDSISDILYKQFDEISLHTGNVIHDDKTDEKGIAEINDILHGYNCETSEMFMKQITARAEKASAKANILCGISDEEVSRFVTIKDRITGEKYTLDNSGVIINEKLATLLGGIKAGDEITVSMSDTENARVRVSAICENYAYHYIYLTEDYYAQVFGEKPDYNMIYFNAAGTDDLPKALQDEISEKLLDIDGVLAVPFKTAVVTTFEKMIKTLSMVVVVLIVSAGLLAFIVLYNLTNININERIREIATLKVLGFYNGEVSIYIFREIMLLTLLGTGTGLILGRFLADFVVKTAEVDMVMFGREIHLSSFLISVGITLMFALVVMLVMHRSLRKIDMVEALKSVE